jgi:uncharacterized protein (DUF305 family)
VGRKQSTRKSIEIVEYNSMFTNMNSNNLNIGNSIDEAFTIGMIKHHQMAIDMANNIIKVQSEEIEQMKEILNTIEKSN